MENIGENSQSGDKKRNWKRVIVAILLALAILLYAFLILGGNNNKKKLEPDSEKPVEAPKISDNFLDYGQGNLDVNELGSSSSSENFKVNQIRFGGNIPLVDSNQKDINLEVYNIKSEMVASRENEEPRFLLTWETSKAAISEVVYAKDDGSNPRIISEDSYGFKHSVLMSDIDLSTIYIYRISSRDRWGNQKTTDYFSMYTGEKATSVFDLIVGSIEEIFSWTVSSD